MGFLADYARIGAGTPQTERADPRQVRNAAGGYVFPADAWQRLDRFLILGTQGGTYYTDQKTLTDENLNLVRACIAEDGPRVVQRIFEISTGGRAPKQEYGLFALALCIASRDLSTVKAAYANLSAICRTGATFFQLLAFLRGTRSSLARNDKGRQRALFTGNGLKRAVARWFDEKPVDRLAYQMVKYRQRYGLEVRDALRLAHPNPLHGLVTGVPGTFEVPLTPSLESQWSKRGALYRWGAKKIVDFEAPGGKLSTRYDDLPQVVKDFQVAQSAEAVDNRVALATVLPREALPTSWLNDPKVWEALLFGGMPNDDAPEHAGNLEIDQVFHGSGMPVGAMIRNLGKMTSLGLLNVHTPGELHVANVLRDTSRIRAARIHPIAIYLAAKQYALGRGDKGKLTWAPNGAILDALEAAFELAFANVEPIGVPQLVAVDSSGSMTHPVSGYTNITAREIGLAFASVIMRTERQARMLAFTDGSNDTEMLVAPNERLRDLIHRFEKTVAGNGTDLSIPALWCGGGTASEGRSIYGRPRGFTYHPHFAEVEAITIFTDGETWAGSIHVHQAIANLRQSTGKPVKFIVASTAANKTQISDPNDTLSLGICGFDSSVPQLVREFIRG